MVREGYMSFKDHLRCAWLGAFIIGAIFYGLRSVLIVVLVIGALCYGLW